MFFRKRHPTQAAVTVGNRARLRSRYDARDAPFTRADLDLIMDVHELKIEFKRFVLRRFGDYTRAFEVYDTIEGKRVPPLDNPFATSDGGAGYWEVQNRWVETLKWVSRDEPGTEAFITVQHYVAGDRGPGTIDFRVRVPLSFIFAETDPTPPFK